MRLVKFTVHNYKSLRFVSFCPTPLTAIVGPNASGKTNFSDAMDFLSDVYTHGLELAVVRKGGFENIAFRKMRRTKSAIEFEVTVSAKGSEIRRMVASRSRHTPSPANLQLTHKFSIGTSGTGIRADFKVINEEFRVQVIEGSAPDPPRNRTIVCVRSGPDRKIEVEEHEESPLVKELMRYASAYFESFEGRAPISAQELFLSVLPLRNAFFTTFTNSVSRFEVYQISPRLSRSSGVPTPNPKLSRVGENLPALVDWLQRRHPQAWEVVMAGMRDILQDLREIKVDYLHNKTLGLFFYEEGAGRPWSVEDVSDGTVQALALLVASVDPRSTLLMVEEPENSVHPWIIRVLISRLREVSDQKNVVITTHSPVVVNLLEPHELWVASRKMGETQLQRLTDLEPGIAANWESGKFRLSEFLDAGFVPQAVPGGA